jgi:tRNA 2-thiocytidine biosynthesis protein TtcA
MLDEADDIHALFRGAPKTTEFRKLRKRLVQQVREALETYGMVSPGARWLVCLSGGKDSYTLLAVLHELQWRGLLPVELWPATSTRASRVFRQPSCPSS